MGWLDGQLQLGIMYYRKYYMITPQLTALNNLLLQTSPYMDVPVCCVLIWNIVANFRWLWDAEELPSGTEVLLISLTIR